MNWPRLEYNTSTLNECLAPDVSSSDIMISNPPLKIEVVLHIFSSQTGYIRMSVLHYSEPKFPVLFYVLILIVALIGKEITVNTNRNQP